MPRMPRAWLLGKVLIPPTVFLRRWKLINGSDDFYEYLATTEQIFDSPRQNNDKHVKIAIIDSGIYLKHPQVRKLRLENTN